MTEKCISLDKMTDGKTLPITIEIGGEERIVDVLRYLKHIDLPAPISSFVEKGEMQQIPLGLTDSLNKMRFFCFRGDVEEGKICEIADTVQNSYDIDTGTFKNEAALRTYLCNLGICNYEIRDVLRGQKDYEMHEDKIPVIPLDVNVAANDKGMLINYSVDYGPFVFWDIAKTVGEYYDTATGTLRDKEELEKIIEDYGKTFDIEREHLISAVHFGLGGRVFTPEPRIGYEFENKYHPDEYGVVHIPEDDKVVQYIIDMIFKESESPATKTVYVSRQDFEKNRTAAS